MKKKNEDNSRQKQDDPKDEGENIELENFEKKDVEGQEINLENFMLNHAQESMLERFEREAEVYENEQRKQWEKIRKERELARKQGRSSVFEPF